MSDKAFRLTSFSNLLFLMAAVVGVWLSAQFILKGSAYLLMPLGAVAGTIAIFHSIKNWRRGVLIFLAWMLFEDLVRKWAANNMAIYFAKDVLAAACCIGFYRVRNHERTLRTKPGFFLPLVFFFAWSVLEVFNPDSPSVWYGLVGLKLYFGYVPLFFLGYALLRSEEDLQRLLLFTLCIAGAIAALGLLQGITGQTLLAPADLAPDIRELGTLVRTVPSTHKTFIRATSVFVSDGRFAGFLLLAWLLGIATAAYFFVRRLPKRGWLLAVLALLMASILLSGSRAGLMYSLISVGIIGATYTQQLLSNIRLRRAVFAVTAALFLAIISVAFLWAAYPEAIGPRIDWYTETLLPGHPNFDLAFRSWDYPLGEFKKAFDYPEWVLGGGTGTRSFGGQYVSRIFNAPPALGAVESGYGNLMLEMGVPGLLLWLAWTIAALISQWKIMRKLRGTPLFPISFSVFFLSFILLFTGMTGALVYQNYVTNAFLWLLLGVLLALPSVLNVHESSEQKAGVWRNYRIID